MLTRDYHNKSALPSPYPSLVYLFFKRSRLAYKTLLKIEQQKYDFIKAHKRQVNTRYEIVVFISSYSEHSNHKSSFCNKKFTNQKQIDA